MRGAVYKTPLYLDLLHTFRIRVGTVVFTVPEKIVFIPSCEKIFCDMGSEIVILYILLCN